MVALLCAGVVGLAMGVWVLLEKRSGWARLEAEAFREASLSLTGKAAGHRGDAHLLEVAFGHCVVRAEAGPIGMSQWRQVRYSVEDVPVLPLLGAREAVEAADLDDPTRRSILELFDQGEVKLARGRLEVVVPRRALRAELVQASMRAMARAAYAIRAAGEERRARTEELFQTSDDAEARRQAYGELAAVFPAAAARLADRAAEDEDPVVRAMGAARLGTAGLATLREILANEDSEAIVVAAAAEGLAADPEAEELLIALLGPAARSGGVEIPTTPSILGLAQTATTMEARPTEVRIAAARALGASGSVRAVEALRRETHGILVDPDLRTAALDAIAAIHARVPDAQPGRVTLARPGDEGAVSMAASDRGEVELVDAERSR